MTHEERIAELSIAVDLRLTELWALICEGGSVLAEVLAEDAAREAFASCLRTAYAQGYNDALLEDQEGRRGELARAFGYAHH